YYALQTPDGGFVLAGSRSYRNFGYEGWLIKTDGRGNLRWIKPFRGSGLGSIYSVIMTQDGGFVISGFSSSYQGDDPDAWLIKVGGDTEETSNTSIEFLNATYSETPIMNNSTNKSATESNKKAEGFEMAFAAVMFLAVFKTAFQRTGTGKTIRKNLLIPVIFSLFVLLYSVINGMVLWGLITVLLIMILWMLIYRTFMNKKVDNHDFGKRPIGITMLSILYAITAFLEIYELISHQPVMVLGNTFSGIPGQLIHIIFILIGMYLTYGFIKLLRYGWIIAIIFEIYGLINRSIHLISFGTDMGFGLVVPIFGLLFNIIIILYIIGKGDYFRK
ncbi:MAG: hypothetical protein O8C60_02570, partial [Candidatus Methanoperedens sp.]|nr:hypothetical protein [Candidatus Methanoperedens sp.]